MKKHLTPEQIATINGRVSALNALEPHVRIIYADLIDDIYSLFAEIDVLRQEAFAVDSDRKFAFQALEGAGYTTRYLQVGILNLAAERDELKKLLFIEEQRDVVHFGMLICGDMKNRTDTSIWESVSCRNCLEMMGRDYENR